MSQGPRHRVPFRRRREGVTDYRHRLKLLRSGVPRAVVRFTHRRVVVAITEYDPTGDRVLARAESPELVGVGFPPGSVVSTPASYLTGYLAGLRAKSGGASEVVLDAGLRRPTKGGRLLGALKGLLDAGLEVPHGEEGLPDDQRLSGGHLKSPLTKPLEAYRKELAPIALQPKGTK